MIRPTEKTEQSLEPLSGRSAESAEAWLGHNRTNRRKLWERLNPRHRKDLRLLAEALALQQTHAQLPEPARHRLDAAVAELERVVRRIAALLAEVARRTPPAR
jgi:type II secretory pathway component PulM